MQMSAKDLEANLIYQIGALQAIAAAEGGRVTHVKPHGALHNVACADAEVATTVVKGLRKLDSSLILLAPPTQRSLKQRKMQDNPFGTRYSLIAPT